MYITYFTVSVQNIKTFSLLVDYQDVHVISCDLFLTLNDKSLPVVKKLLVTAHLVNR